MSDGELVVGEDFKVIDCLDHDGRRDVQLVCRHHWWHGGKKASHGLGEEGVGRHELGQQVGDLHSITRPTLKQATGLDQRREVAARNAAEADVSEDPRASAETIELANGVGSEHAPDHDARPVTLGHPILNQAHQRPHARFLAPVATPSAARMGGGTEGIPARRDPTPEQVAYLGGHIDEIVPASFSSADECHKLPY
jgi:hypothetical protein